MTVRFLFLAGLLAMAGCQPGTSDFTTASVGNQAVERSAVDTGKYHYRSGNYGLAQKHYLQATNADPFDPEAWLGLAAAYDQMGRFDLADKAYSQTRNLVGPVPQLLNNMGYSHMLRGNTEKAREMLARARAALPQDQTVAGNQTLLDRL